MLHWEKCHGEKRHGEKCYRGETSLGRNAVEPLKSSKNSNFHLFEIGQHQGLNNFEGLELMKIRFLASQNWVFDNKD